MREFCLVGTGGVATTLDIGTATIAPGMSGQSIYIIGTSNAASVVFSRAAATSLSLGAATRTLGVSDVLHLVYDGVASKWVEVSFVDNSAT